MTPLNKLAKRFELLVRAARPGVAQYTPAEKAFCDTVKYLGNILRAANRYKIDQKAIPVSTTKDLANYKFYVSAAEAIYNRLLPITNYNQSVRMMLKEESSKDLGNSLQYVNSIAELISKSDSLNSNFKDYFKRDYVGYRQQLDRFNRLYQQYVASGSGQVAKASVARDAKLGKSLRAAAKSGYCACSCRDCFEIAIADDDKTPTLCWECKENGCSADDDKECQVPRETYDD